jgi:V/A-type H+-transporting ATPase subunit D
MARLQLTKSSLARETRQLETFRRFLPSLDLKRQQLIAERKKGEAALAATTAEIGAVRTRTARSVPMLADDGLDLRDLVRVETVEIGWENLLGTRLPTLVAVRTLRREYAPLARPHWWTSWPMSSSGSSSSGCAKRSSGGALRRWRAR